jgi:hypothetical protein
MKEEDEGRTPTCGAPIHDLSSAAKCDTGAPESQATCNIGKERTENMDEVFARGMGRTEKLGLHTGVEISKAVAKPD